MSPGFDENKVFLRTWGDIKERLDPNYYKKVYMDLEEMVGKRTKHKLRDFIKLMASGVTPKITEYDKYYSDSVDGIPFLRVQNLSPEGLNWTDCKYINQDTHNGLLKRSQVFQGDLLIKITGVGRMAITSIAPEGFEGNINQHIVVVKTKNSELNEQIATFLNSDIGEMLATHRSTGGTRPALDYAALRSIPIILDDNIVDIMKQAYAEKEEKEKEVKTLSEGISTYLLQELGIALPLEEENVLRNRIFCVGFGDVIGGRFDPFIYAKKYDFYRNPKSLYKCVKFNTLIVSMQTGLPVRQDYRAKQGKYPYYGSNGIIGYMDEYTHDGKYLIIGQDGYIGNHYVVNEKFWASNHNWVIRLNTNMCSYEYIKAFLDVWDYSYLITGGVIPKLTQMSVKNIPIILPDLMIQEKIVSYITQVRTKIEMLEKQSYDIVAIAKDKVKKLLFKEEKCNEINGNY